MNNRMKKIIFLLFFVAGLSANPVIDKDICINEFLILNDSTWVLEVQFFTMFEGYLDTSEYHSMTIGSSYGECLVKPELLRDSLKYLLLTPDSLISPLKINASGDSICLRTYDAHGNRTYKSILRFGSDPYSMVLPPKPGQSIRLVHEKFHDVFCLDNSPTLGFENDTTDIWAQVRGRIWDKDGNPVSNTEFYIYDHYFTSDSQGFFQVRLFARNYRLNDILVRSGGCCFRAFPIDTLFFRLTPDTVVTTDIHLITYTGLEKSPVKVPESIVLYNYPNPFNPGTNFIVELPTSKNFTNAEIRIYNIRGRLLRTLPLQSTKEAVYWNGKDALGRTQPSGKYFYRLILDGKAVRTGSTILLK